MIENLNNPATTPKGETLPKNEEVRIDFHKSNLISLDAVRQAREAERLAEAAHPPKAFEKIEPPTPRDLIAQRGLYVFITRHEEAA